VGRPESSGRPAPLPRRSPSHRGVFLMGVEWYPQDDRTGCYLWLLLILAGLVIAAVVLAL